ncbi:unnamed protein product [Protopolystoma xenopodis]|uniref:Uncharacterized protein n=1 Tax=Protopolystoma xenopodis TaxID=117903 RepID=A0A448X9T0_9PLAT|nr:unnamed protein product [Protopolystoma xenopodis]
MLKSDAIRKHVSEFQILLLISSWHEEHINLANLPQPANDQTNSGSDFDVGQINANCANLIRNCIRFDKMNKAIMFGLVHSGYGRNTGVRLDKLTEVARREALACFAASQVAVSCNCFDLKFCGDSLFI